MQETQSQSADRIYTPSAASYDASHHADLTRRFVELLPPLPLPVPPFALASLPPPDPARGDGGDEADEPEDEAGGKDVGAQTYLDLACGTGLMAFRIADALATSSSPSSASGHLPPGKADRGRKNSPPGHARVIGVDASSGMLRAAAAKLRERGPEYAGAGVGVEFWRGDVLDLAGAVEVDVHSPPWAEEEEAAEVATGGGGLAPPPATLITLASALPLLPSPRRALATLSALLRPGALLAFDTPHPRSTLPLRALDLLPSHLPPALSYPPTSSLTHPSLSSVRALAAALEETAGTWVQDAHLLRHVSSAPPQTFTSAAADATFSAATAPSPSPGHAGSRLRAFAAPLRAAIAAHPDPDAAATTARAAFRRAWSALGGDGELDASWLVLARRPLAPPGAEQPVVFRGACACGGAAYEARLHPLGRDLCSCPGCRAAVSGGSRADVRAGGAGGGEGEAAGLRLLPLPRRAVRFRRHASLQISVSPAYGHGGLDGPGGRVERGACGACGAAVFVRALGGGAETHGRWNEANAEGAGAAAVVGSDGLLPEWGSFRAVEVVADTVDRESWARGFGMPRVGRWILAENAPADELAEYSGGGQEVLRFERYPGSAA